jgi:hypothetical protein
MPDESSVELSVKLSADLCRRLDQWAARNAIRSRQTAIAELLESGLAPKVSAPSQGARAELLAGNQIDLMEDFTATREEKRIRKRRLTRGPTVFREARRDQPKDKA